MKISEIILNNYRAFFNEKGTENTKHRIDFAGRQNLLIYGENGSGKSSVFKGLKDLFKSGTDPDCNVVQNVFSRQVDSDHQPFVKTTFTGEGDPETFTFSADPHIPHPDHDLLRSVARIRSFMSYRDLMRIHFIDDPRVNLFDFLFGRNGLLSEMPNPAASQAETSISMSELWQNVRDAPDDTNRTDFRNGVNQILSDLSTYLNALLKYFDQSLTVSFEPFTKEAAASASPHLHLEVSYFGTNLNEEPENYHHFLNEARLSALAICIFLAAHLSVPSAAYEILFLDDIFTGLDTSNRMPLLDILTATEINGTEGDTFTNHQIILTTYDRQWYELARNHLGQSHWSYQEIYIDHHSAGFDQPALLPGKDNYAKAQHFFAIKDYLSCANYQRKVCERLIKDFLPEHRKYNKDGKGDIRTLDQLGELTDALLGYLNQLGIDSSPLDNLKKCTRIILNPFSHDDIDSPAYRREIQMVFDLINILKTLKTSLLLKAGTKVFIEKNHGETEILHKYEFELAEDVRVIGFQGNEYLPPINLLPLQFEIADTHRIMSQSGSLETLYGRICHFLKVEKGANPFNDFTLNAENKLSDVINIQK